MSNVFNLPDLETQERMAIALEKIANTRVQEDYTQAPGNKFLMGGDRSAGFFGFVQTSDFISGDDLALELGLTNGASQNSDAAWIKYIWDGKICFTPLKTLRYSVTWDAIYAVGAVYGTGSAISDGEQWMLDNDENYGEDGIARVSQNAQVVIDGLAYRVRLMRGAASDPSDSYSDSDRGSVGDENEWNAIMLPLHERAKLQNWNYSAYAGTTEYWGTDLTDEDMRTHYNYGNGSYSWCQETRDTLEGAEIAYRRVLRGYLGASYLGASASSPVASNLGFHPVLELIG